MAEECCPQSATLQQTMAPTPLPGISLHPSPCVHCWHGPIDMHWPTQPDLAQLGIRARPLPKRHYCRDQTYGASGNMFSGISSEKLMILLRDRPCLELMISVTKIAPQHRISRKCPAYPEFFWDRKLPANYEAKSFSCNCCQDQNYSGSGKMFPGIHF